MRRPQNIILWLLCLAWLLPGVVGHAPWKGVDGAHFARLLTALHSGDWWTPGMTGEDWPPLYFWTSAATAWLSSPLLALHDGARLASGVFLVTALVFTARAAAALYGTDHRWAGALALLGSVGLLLRGHEMNAYTAQLAGVAMVLDGLARLPKDARGGVILGSGLTLMLLATGLPEPLALALLAGLLPGVSPAYRPGLPGKGLLLGLLAWIVVAGLWIAFLAYRHEPLVLALQLQRLPGWGGLAPSRPLYVLGLLPWYTWPAWPLAGWALYRARRTWREPGIVIPLSVFLVLLGVFSAGQGYGEDKLLALTAPLALLAARGLFELKRGAANALLWFAVMLFTFMALVFWVYWSAHDLGMPEIFARRLVKLRVEGIGQLRLAPLVLGAILTVAWGVFLARLERAPLRPLLAWSGGLTFVWVLLLALFLDVLDARLSYARVGKTLKETVPAGECVNADRVAAQQRILVAYHSGVELKAKPTAECRWLLVQNKRREAARLVKSNWARVLDTARPGDREDLFRLYVRK